jgi:hypothetical protein
MYETQFEWDKSKSRSNEKKHGLSFEEARSIFYDENAIEFHDPDHSQHEDRFLLLGMSYRLRVLLVCHCHRKEDSIIRIISARKATRKEAKRYEEGNI